MGKLTNLNPPAPIADADLPSSIARDSEITAASNAHLGAANPHTQYRLSAVIGIKEKLISGTVNNTAGDTGVLHGISPGIIVGIQCTILDEDRNWRVPPGFVGTGYDYFTYTTPTHFVIFVPGTNSERVKGRPFNALLTYLT